MQEAAIKAEINQAKNTFDLVRMANAIVRLDALHAEMDAAGNSGLPSPGTSEYGQAWKSLGDYMARRTARKMKRAAAKKTATKRLAQRYEAPTGSLKGREARAEERFRELAAWYVLQGMDEATARQLAQDEMDNDTRKD